MESSNSANSAKPKENWSTGLFGCFSDIGNCCTTCWCPCITFGQIADILDQGSPSCFISARNYGMLMYLTFVGCCFYSCSYRAKLRHMYNLPKAPCGCGDCLVHVCCEPCALCQEYRELQNQGFNMAVGYKVNMAARKQNTHQSKMGTLTAPATQTMPQMTHDDNDNDNNDNNDDDNDN